MKWTVPGDPEERMFDDKYPALARAWELTPLGEHRPEPIQVRVQDTKFEFEVTDLKLFTHRYEDDIDIFVDDRLIATKSMWSSPTMVDVTAELVAPYGVTWSHPDEFKESVKERIDEFLKAKGYTYDNISVESIKHLVGSTKGHRIIVQAVVLLGDRP